MPDMLIILCSRTTTTFTVKHCYSQSILIEQSIILIKQSAYCLFIHLFAKYVFHSLTHVHNILLTFSATAKEAASCWNTDINSAPLWNCRNKTIQWHYRMFWYHSVQILIRPATQCIIPLFKVIYTHLSLFLYSSKSRCKKKILHILQNVPSQFHHFQIQIV